MIGEEKPCLAIDLVSLYVLISQYRSCNCQRAASRRREAARRQPNRAVRDCSRGRKKATRCNAGQRMHCFRANT